MSGACSIYQLAITNNGTAIAYPKFYFRFDDGTGPRLLYIKNETTGATLWLNHTMLIGETLTIDTSLDNRSVVSSYWGNVIGSALLRNSDFSDFYLLPGTNKISVFANDAPVTEPVITAAMWWPINHWSLDGSAT